MGLWFVEPQLDADEQRLHHAAANQLLGLTRTLGGKLVVTNRRVLFEPNRLDRLTGGKPWQTDISAIREVAIRPGGKDGVRRYGPAGSRPHVMVATNLAEPGVFVVRNRESLVAAITKSGPPRN